MRLAAVIRVFIGQVFRYAMATGKADSDPTTALRGALKTYDVEHHAPLAKADIPAFFDALATKARANRPTEIALRLLAYLFTRPSELGGAAWTEFDLERCRVAHPGGEDEDGPSSRCLAADASGGAAARASRP